MTSSRLRWATISLEVVALLVSLGVAVTGRQPRATRDIIAESVSRQLL